MRTMIDGQRFFLRAFQTGPLGDKIEHASWLPTRKTGAMQP